MSKKSIPVTINLSKEMYAGPSLPQTWQVIYQEGIRGNHLLFSLADLKSFEHQPTISLDPQTEKRVIEHAMKLVKCTSLGEIRTQISSMPQRQKAIVFRLYQRFLSNWQNYALAQMN